MNENLSNNQKEFISKFHQALFCSQKCATLSVRKFEISKEELEALAADTNNVLHKMTPESN